VALVMAALSACTSSGRFGGPAPEQVAASPPPPPAPPPPPPNTPVDLAGKWKLSAAGGGIMSGGYLFEFQDEWWKEAQRRPATWSSHDTTILTSTFPFGEPGRGGFSSYWDEEWFGLMSVAPNPGRRAADPVLKISDGERSLNGGADILTPRAGYYALQGVFNGTNPSPPLIVSHLTAISFPPHANSH